MRVEIRKAKTEEDESAVINAVEVTDSIRRAVDLLQGSGSGIPVFSGNDTLVLRNDQIYYIESVDKRTYV